MNRFANPYQRQQHAKTVDILQCACWFPEEQQDKLAAVARWTAVLTPLLKMHCRWQTDVHIQLKVSHNSNMWLLPGLIMNDPSFAVPCNAGLCQAGLGCAVLLCLWLCCHALTRLCFFTVSLGPDCWCCMHSYQTRQLHMAGYAV